MSTALRTLSVASAAFALAACGSMQSGSMGSGDTQTFRATLSSSAEVPSNASGGTGTLEATLNKTTNVLSYRVTYSGLTGPAIMAHFHGPAMPGANAGVVVPFVVTPSPIVGQATLTAPQLADLMAGKWYVNIHTPENKGGEIRGQVLVN